MEQRFKDLKERLKVDREKATSARAAKNIKKPRKVEQKKNILVSRDVTPEGSNSEILELLKQKEELEKKIKECMEGEISNRLTIGKTLVENDNAAPKKEEKRVNSRHTFRPVNVSKSDAVKNINLPRPKKCDKNVVKKKTKNKCSPRKGKN